MSKSKAKLAVALTVAMILSQSVSTFASIGSPIKSDGTIEFKAGQLEVIDPTDPTGTKPTSPTNPTNPSDGTDPDNTNPDGTFNYRSSNLSWGTRLISGSTQQYMTNDPASVFDTGKGEVQPASDLRKAGVVVVDNSGERDQKWKLTVAATEFQQSGSKVLHGCEFRFKPEISPWTDDGNKSAAPVFGVKEAVKLNATAKRPEATVQMHQPFMWLDTDGKTDKSQTITVLTTEGVIPDATYGIANGAWYADWSGYLKVLPSTYNTGSEIKTELTWTVTKTL